MDYKEITSICNKIRSQHIDWNYLQIATEIANQLNMHVGDVLDAWNTKMMKKLIIFNIGPYEEGIGHSVTLAFVGTFDSIEEFILQHNKDYYVKDEIDVFDSLTEKWSRWTKSKRNHWIEYN